MGVGGRADEAGGALKGIGMEQFDQAWEYDPEYGAEYDEAFGPDLDPDLDPDIDPEVLYLRMISDEERQRFWPEARWESPFDDGSAEAGSRDAGPLGGGPASVGDLGVPGDPPLLFVDHAAELRLGREMRLSELWGHAERGALLTSELVELTMLVSEVEGVPGAVCADCAMLKRPSLHGNWALAITGLCRVHLRLRLGHEEIDRAT